MKINLNLKVRRRNPWFWVGIGGIILTAMGVSPEMFTSWGLVWEAIVGLFTNPFKLVTVILAVLGVFVDPTTAGVGDSTQAMTYDKPKKESK